VAHAAVGTVNGGANVPHFFRLISGVTRPTSLEKNLAVGGANVAGPFLDHNSGIGQRRVVAGVSPSLSPHAVGVVVVATMPPLARLRALCA